MSFVSDIKDVLRGMSEDGLITPMDEYGVIEKNNKCCINMSCNHETFGQIDSIVFLEKATGYNIKNKMLTILSDMSPWPFAMTQTFHISELRFVLSSFFMAKVCFKVGKEVMRPIIENKLSNKGE